MANGVEAAWRMKFTGVRLVSFQNQVRPILMNKSVHVVSLLVQSVCVSIVSHIRFDIPRRMQCAAGTSTFLESDRIRGCPSRTGALFHEDPLRVPRQRLPT